jgi:CRISPR-associated protein Cas1
LRGEAIHKRVDSGNGALPAAKKKAKKTTQDEPAATVDATANEPEAQNAEPETIHSRSVQMGSERLGVVAKMDLVEVRAARANVATSEAEDLFSVLEVCPVDYKAGAPKEGDEANELWDTDKMQLGLQALILRDNGYICNEGVIYYRATKQRVRLPITPELENWILQNIAEAKRVITGPIPAPLIHSPKCVRCSLAPVCLPDETRMLAQTRAAIDLRVGEATDTPEDSKGVAGEPPRRLIAARDDTRPLYLNTQGYRVGCKDEVLTVKEKDRVIEEVRMRDLSHVALFGNIQISTQAIQSLCEQEIPVTYFSMGGWFYGITRGHALKNVFLRMEQFRFARDETVCLSLARQFVHGKIRNHRTLLMRNHLEPPEPIILKLKRASEDALAAASIAELLGIEGAAASQYFQQFSGMVKVEDDDLPGLEMPGKNAKQLAFNFNFTNRNRRPPTDPVNAMLSLAYSMLAKDCTLAALAVGFDPYIGFYHQPRFGRPALGLDLMEEMRPLVAESTVLSCINNRVVTEKDFVRAGQAVNLTAPGRKRFFQMYEQRMSSLITHPLFDYKVSYRRALELQARLLAKTLTGEIAEYIPLLTR